jgi:hypothetical protein
VGAINVGFVENKAVIRHPDSINIPYLQLQSQSKETDKRVQSPFRTPDESEQESNAFLGTFAKLRKAILSFIMSVRQSARYNWAPIGRNVIKFYI